MNENKTDFSEVLEPKSKNTLKYALFKAFKLLTPNLNLDYSNFEGDYINLFKIYKKIITGLFIYISGNENIKYADIPSLTFDSNIRKYVIYIILFYKKGDTFLKKIAKRKFDDIKYSEMTDFNQKMTTAIYNKIPKNIVEEYFEEWKSEYKKDFIKVLKEDNPELVDDFTAFFESQKYSDYMIDDTIETFNDDLFGQTFLDFINSKESQLYNPELFYFLLYARYKKFYNYTYYDWMNRCESLTEEIIDKISLNNLAKQTYDNITDSISSALNALQFRINGNNVIAPIRFFQNKSSINKEWTKDDNDIESILNSNGLEFYNNYDEYKDKLERLESMIYHCLLEWTDDITTYL